MRVVGDYRVSDCGRLIQPVLGDEVFRPFLFIHNGEIPNFRPDTEVTLGSSDYTKTFIPNQLRSLDTADGLYLWCVVAENDTSKLLRNICKNCVPIQTGHNGRVVWAIAREDIECSMTFRQGDGSLEIRYLDLGDITSEFTD